MSNKEKISEQARLWVLRNYSQDMSEMEKSAFDEWLASHQEHREAYKQLEQVWYNLDELQEDLEELDLRENNEFTSDDFVQNSGEINALEIKQTPFLPNIVKVPRVATFGAALLAVLLLVFAEDIWIAAYSDEATYAGVTRIIELPDHSKVTLNTHTAIAINYSTGERRISLLKGEAFFEVRSDPSRPFRVEALNRVSEAVGTNFAVRLTDDSAIVTVTEGKVALSPSKQTREQRTSDQPLLSANSQVAYSNASVSEQKNNVNIVDLLAWRDGNIILKDMSLSEAIVELKRYYPGRILLTRSAKTGPLVNGKFRTNKIETAIRAIAAVYGLSVAKPPGTGILIIY